MRLKKISLMAGAFLGTLLIAPAEATTIIYDTATPANPGYQATPEDRELLRDVLNTAEKAEVTRSAVQSEALTSPMQPALGATDAPQAMMQAPVVAAAPTTVEVENMSKAELMRRERMRVELRNEDVLQERLEALRLRDENRRTKQLLGAEGEEVAAEAAPIRALQMQEQAVGELASEQPVATEAGIPVTAAAVDQVSISQAAPAPAASVGSWEDQSFISKIVVSPRAGLSNMSGDNYLDVRARYSAGIGLGFAATENVSLELGYAFSEFGIVPDARNGLANMVKTYSPAAWYNPELEVLSYKQNVFDVGLKLHLLNSSARIRPFVGGGAAYSKGFVNYDAPIRDAARQYGYDVGPDYEVSSILGQLSTGLDIALSRNISVTAMFRYHKVMTSRENQQFNNYAFAYGYNLPAFDDPDKRFIGGSLARSSFYSITGGVNFSF